MGVKLLTLFYFFLSKYNFKKTLYHPFTKNVRYDIFLNIPDKGIISLFDF